MLPPPEHLFSKTKASEENGKPLLLYHGTPYTFQYFSDAKPVSIGHHFGTIEQASHRIRCGDGLFLDRSHIFPVYLDIRNPIDCGNSDIGFESPIQSAFWLKDHGFLTSAQAWEAAGLKDTISSQYQAWLDEVTAHEADGTDTITKARWRTCNQALWALLMEQEWDGFRYSNQNEVAKGEMPEDSYAVFSSKQIYSAITGECLSGD